MNVVRKERAEVKPSYSGVLSMYKTPPIEDMNIDEFETYAFSRLQVLQKLDDAKAGGSERAKEDAQKAVRDFKDAKEDHISHFILRIAYCRTEELRRWFLANECALFRERFILSVGSVRQSFLQNEGLQFHPLSDEEKKDTTLKAKLDTLGRSMYKGKYVESSSFYKVPFEEAAELVAQRKVYLREGMAYVHENELHSIILGIFRARLSRSLISASKAWAHVQLDERLLPFLTNISKTYLGNDYSGGGVHGRMTLADVDLNAKKSFPLCMRVLYDKVREDHHLKHQGRMQLGLFLKGIGLRLEDALAWWRREFTKKMPAEQFDKQHAYNIRHNYGKEGKRTDYTPYSCMKIISADNPVADQCHGCPYKVMDEERLRAVLRKVNVPSKDISDIVHTAKEGNHYQIACGKYFTAMHPQQDVRVTHPNQYFDDSVSVLTGGSPKPKDNVKEEPASQIQHQSQPTPVAAHS